FHRDARSSRRARADRPHPPHGRDRRGRAPVDRALLPRGLRALPRLAREREAPRHVVLDAQVQGRGPGASSRGAAGLERAHPLAGLWGRGGGRRRGGARCGHLPARAAVIAFLVRRLAYGVATVLGVLLFLFVLFFLYAHPEDIARRAIGEKAPPQAI